MNPYQVILTIGGWTLDPPIEVTAGTPSEAAAEAVRSLSGRPPGPVQRATVIWRRVYGVRHTWRMSEELVLPSGGDPLQPIDWRAG